MGYSFVCSLTHLDLDKIKGNYDNIKKDFTIRAIYTSMASLGYGPHLSLLSYI